MGQLQGVKYMCHRSFQRRGERKEDWNNIRRSNGKFDETCEPIGPNSTNSKHKKQEEKTLKLIIIKLLKTSDKEKNLKSNQKGKRHITYKVKKYKDDRHFS